MRNYRLHILRLSLLFFSIFITTACNKDNFTDEDELLALEVPVELQLQLSLKGTDTDSRTRTVVGDLDGFDPEENKITSITVFVINLDASNNLDWNKVKYSSQGVNQPPSPSNLKFTVNVKLKTSPGKKYIYVGANMTPDQRESFCANKGVYTSQGTTYTDVINDFVDINSNGRGIVMFGQMHTETTFGIFDNPVVEITGPTDETNPLNTKLELSRVVSKVALTYEPSTPGFATIASGIDGSINANNIYFMLNNTSKSIDFIKGMNSGYSRYSMNGYMAYNTNSSFNSLMYYYRKNPTNDFMFYAAPDPFVYGENESDNYTVAKIDLPFDMGTDNPYCQGLEEYDPLLTWEKHYTSSLYCLENTVETDDVPDPTKVLSMRHGINTRVVVAAKYTPEKVWHYDGSSLTEWTILSESAMDAITNNPADAANGVGTFYAVLQSTSPINVYKYYTYDAVEHLINLGGDLPNFITYKGGYGYYATLISQQAIPADQLIDDNYNMYRNNYYVLRVQEFIPPGVVYPQDVYMLVNSVKTPWTTGKITTVTVD